MTLPDPPVQGVALIGIVEADSRERDRLLTLMHGAGIEVASFDSAENYLRESPEPAQTCLIVDLALPGMSGLELLKLLRQAGSVVPVILLADETDVQTAVTAMREGATDFVEKPWADATILRRVRRLLTLSPGPSAH